MAAGLNVRFLEQLSGIEVQAAIARSCLPDSALSQSGKKVKILPISPLAESVKNQKIALQPIFVRPRTENCRAW